MTALSTSHVSVVALHSLLVTPLTSPTQAAAKLFVKSGKKDAKIVLVSSTLGLMGLVGYTQYSPMKFAIRGES